MSSLNTTSPPSPPLLPSQPSPRASFKPPVADTTTTTTFNSLPKQSHHTHLHENVFESPSLSHGNVLARFEFETGRKPSSSRTGTKILMVEWEENTTTSCIPGGWEISWLVEEEGGSSKNKKQNTTVREDTGGEGGVNRLYFLLGPGLSIPTTIFLSKGESSSGKDDGEEEGKFVRWRTNPLPAIFSPELGASAMTAGKRGVLHTIWAKKRLQVLKGEVESERERNGEGIGLEMAVAEMEWIERNFGVVVGGGGGGGDAKPAGLGISTVVEMESATTTTTTTKSSPGRGGMMEKLKGLKIGTSERELSSSSIPIITKGRIENGDDDDDDDDDDDLFALPLSPRSPEMSQNSSAFSRFRGIPGG